MKISETWLRELVNPKINRNDLAHDLTMAGFEVEDLARVANEFSGVVIGEVLKTEKHPEADRLTICEVSTGGSNHLQIVCGAANVRPGMKVPVANIGAVLSKDMTIKQTVLRGVASHGMLCSAVELGLAEESQGILELAQDAPLGKDIKEYLHLDDYIIDISITPNRGDCLSVRGIAREVAAITHTQMIKHEIHPVAATVEDKFPVRIEHEAACPHYVGRVIRHVKADAQTPTWLKEKLRRVGARSITPVVDVMNYVMYELGQPMHAFDLNTLQKEIVVRQSKPGELIVLLDGTTKELDGDTLVIADHVNPVAIAGVMGGLDSSVTLLTQDIFLESAYFSPSVVARQRQFYGLNTEGSYRFERTVDPTMQTEAIERATQLILEIAGGAAGPIVTVKNRDFPPAPAVITLTKEKLAKILGIVIPDKDVEAIFTALQLTFKSNQQGWTVTAPLYRADLTLPEDLVEEVARIYGYNKIPTHNLRAELQANAVENVPDLQPLRQAFCDLGYHEVISYSFIDKKLQSLFDPNEKARELLNPMTAEMEVMRTNLWPGLMNTYLYNKSRQQRRVRLFEMGMVFLTRGNELRQESKVSGMIAGSALPEQWGVKSREVDFYDLKGDIENIIGMHYPVEAITTKPATHPALHPGQSAALYYEDQSIGLLGRLHPSIEHSLAFEEPVYVFEIDLDSLKRSIKRQFNEFSKFPEIRRDLAIIVKQAIPAKEIQDTIKIAAGDWLKDVFIFDVYQGKGIAPGSKSIALGLIVQHPTRTLVDEEVAELIDRVITALKGQLGAELRS